MGNGAPWSGTSLSHPTADSTLPLPRYDGDSVWGKQPSSMQPGDKLTEFTRCGRSSPAFSPPSLRDCPPLQLPFPPLQPHFPQQSRVSGRGCAQPAGDRSGSLPAPGVQPHSRCVPHSRSPPVIKLSSVLFGAPREPPGTEGCPEPSVQQLRCPTGSQGGGSLGGVWLGGSPVARGGPAAGLREVPTPQPPAAAAPCAPSRRALLPGVPLPPPPVPPGSCGRQPRDALRCAGLSPPPPLPVLPVSPGLPRSPRSCPCPPVLPVSSGLPRSPRSVRVLRSAPVPPVPPCAPVLPKPSGSCSYPPVPP